jgi:protein phosphatase
MKRRLNEDVFLVDREMGIYLVADGMGGHAAGEVASRLAADEIIRIFQERSDIEGDTWPEHWNVATSATANILVDAILSGHDRVTSAVSADENLKGMGTTVVAAVHRPYGQSLTICHVGDSRAYRLRQGELTLLTQDHSWVHEQVAAGFLTEEAARSHPLKNVVTQALGGSSQPRVDILETEIEAGDLYLLCSDGLNSMLTDDEIAVAIREQLPLGEVGRNLIVLANERGGNDNISVVLLQPVIPASSQ